LKVIEDFTIGGGFGRFAEGGGFASFSTASTSTRDLTAVVDDGHVDVEKFRTHLNHYIGSLAMRAVGFPNLDFVFTNDSAFTN
jgi:hypothetical protein